MRKLLSANFFRLFRDRFFWLCMAAMFGYCVVVMFNVRMDVLSGDVFSLESCIFHVGVIIGAFGAFFVSMFLGTEYGDGTMRNKIVAGHTRVGIYMANLVCVFVAALLMMFTWIIGVVAMGMPFLGACKISAANLAVYLLIAVLCTAAFSAIFTCAGMLSDNKAVTVVISVLLILGMFIAAMTIYSKLDAPPTIPRAEFVNNELVMSEAPNDRYLTGMKREVYAFILDVLPMGQGMKLGMLEVGTPVRMAVLSVVITAVISLGGILAFQKKDLK